MIIGAPRIGVVGTFFAILVAVFAAAEEPRNGGPSIDEVMSVPYVTGYAANTDGDVVWVEYRRGLRNVFVARAPKYTTVKTTDFADDDGDEILLIEFGPADEVVFIRGLPGMNPTHRPDGTVMRLLAAFEGAPVRTILDEVPAGFSAAVVSPDGKAVLAAVGGSVWSYPVVVSGAEATRHFTVRGRVTALVPSPDGGRVAFVTDRSQYDRGKYSYVGVFDFATRKIRYMQPGLGMDQSITWSPDGARLAFIRFGYEPRTWRFSNHREGAPFSVVVADAATGEGSEIFTSEIGYGSRFSGFGGSGYSGLGGSNNVIWLADDTLLFPYEKTGWRLLYAVSADGGAARPVTPGDFEINGAAPLPDRSGALFWANSEKDLDRLGLYRLMIDGGLRPERLDVEGVDEMVYGAAVPLLSGRIACSLGGPHGPPRLMVTTPKSETLQLNTGPDPAFPQTPRFPIPEMVSYASLDGMRIPAVMFRPVSPSEGGKSPVIVWAHGGSRSQVYPIYDPAWTRGPVLRYLLGQGYWVFVPNYRSGTGYGLDYRETESYGGRGAGDVQDFIAAADYLTATYPEVDPKRIAIFGTSYGGHIVTNTLARSDKFSAGISFAGVGDWVVEMETDFGEELQFNIPERYEIEKLAHLSSAISKIDDWGDEPILFIHGDNDSSAAMKQSLELYLALKRRGKTAEASIYPGEAHGFKTAANNEKMIRVMVDFLDTYNGAD